MIKSDESEAKAPPQRQFISLMKELGSDDKLDEPEDNFLDIVFGLGEVVELCGLNGTGKTQTCF